MGCIGNDLIAVGVNHDELTVKILPQNVLEADEIGVGQINTAFRAESPITQREYMLGL